MKPVKEHAEYASQHLDWRIRSGSAATHQQPNAITTEHLTFLERNVVGCQDSSIFLGLRCGLLARLEIQRLGLAQQTDHRLDHMHLHLGIHLPGRLQTAMHNVIATASRVMTIAMALGTIAYGMISIVAGAFGREAYGEGRLLAGATVLVLAYHGNLLHRMQYIAKFEICVLPMYLVGALDAQIQWRRTVGCIGDANAVIVAHLGRLSVAGIGTMLALAGERNQIVF